MAGIAHTNDQTAPSDTDSGLLPCVVLLAPGGETRERLSGVLARPGMRAIYCEDALEAAAQVTLASMGKGPASCVLLLDQPRLLTGLRDLLDALPKFVEKPIVWAFEPGPPVSLKDLSWDEASALASPATSVEAGLGNPTGIETPAQTSAREWVASSGETWSMPGLPAASVAGQSRIIEGKPPANVSTISPAIATGIATGIAGGPALRLTSPETPVAHNRAGIQDEGFAAPDVGASENGDKGEATTWLAHSKQVLSDDELAMLLGEDEQGHPHGQEGSERDRT